MTTPEQIALQQMSDTFAKQMLEFTTGMAKQQQDMLMVMMKQMQAVQPDSANTNAIADKHYRKIENFNGDGSWRGWALHSKAATKMANAKAYELLKHAEKEESKIDDQLDLSEESSRMSAGISNVLGTVVKGEPMQNLYNSSHGGVKA